MRLKYVSIYASFIQIQHSINVFFLSFIKFQYTERNIDFLLQYAQYVKLNKAS